MNHDTHDPIEQLRDELGRVTVSQGFAERVRERISDDLEPLRAELADLSVSPEFAVRVRQGIEAGAARRTTWGFNWRWAIPAAGLAAALMAVALWPRTIAEAPVATSLATVTPVVAPPVAPPAVTSSNPQGVLPVAVASRAGRTVAAGSSDPAKAQDPFLNVITDQPELLRRLRVGIDRSDVAVDSSESTAVFEVPVLDVPRVEVSPISLFVVPNPRLPLGVSPMILRIAAEAAERSSK